MQFALAASATAAPPLPSSLCPKQVASYSPGLAATTTNPLAPIAEYALPLPPIYCAAAMLPLQFSEFVRISRQYHAKAHGSGELNPKR